MRVATMSRLKKDFQKVFPQKIFLTKQELERKGFLPTVSPKFDHFIVLGKTIRKIEWDFHAPCQSHRLLQLLACSHRFLT